jgi:hypothetical protein
VPETILEGWHPARSPAKMLALGALRGSAIVVALCVSCGVRTDLDPFDGQTSAREPPPSRGCLDQGAWRRAADMPVPRNDFAMVATRAGALVAGGRGPDGKPTARTDIYDRDRDEWIRGPDLAGPRYWQAAATLDDGRVLVAGGTSEVPYNGAQPGAATAALIDPEKATISTIPPMPVGRMLHTAERLHNGDVLVLGGASADGSRRSALIFEASSETWKVIETYEALATGGVAVVSLDHGAWVATNGHIYFFDETTLKTTLVHVLDEPNLLGSPRITAREGEFIVAGRRNVGVGDGSAIRWQENPSPKSASSLPGSQHRAKPCSSAAWSAPRSIWTAPKLRWPWRFRPSRAWYGWMTGH